MTGLWTNDHDTLAKALGRVLIDSWEEQQGHAQYLIDSGAVRVLDPDDTELRGRLAKRLREIVTHYDADSPKGDPDDWAAGQLIEALRQP
jgi:hypothetical protein